MNDPSPAAIASYFRLLKYNHTFAGFDPPFRLIPADITRVLLVFFGTGPYEIQMGGPVAVGTGMIVPQNSAPFLMEFSKWGGIICGDVYAAGSGAGGTVNSYAISYYPPG